MVELIWAFQYIWAQFSCSSGMPETNRGKIDILSLVSSQKASNASRSYMAYECSATRMPLCSQRGKKQINTPEAEHVAFKLLVTRAHKHYRKQQLSELMQILCFCLSKGTKCVSQRWCDCRHSSLRGMTKKNNHFRPCQHMVDHFRWCHLSSTSFSHKHWQTARYSHCELTFREVVHNSLVITQQGVEIVRQVYNSYLERYCMFNNCFALFSNRYIRAETSGCANALHLHPKSKFKPSTEMGGVGNKPPKKIKSFLCCLAHLSQSAWCAKLTDPKTSKTESKDKGTFHEYCIFRCPMIVLSIRGKISLLCSEKN